MSSFSLLVSYFELYFLAQLIGKLGSLRKSSFSIRIYVVPTIYASLSKRGKFTISILR